jgi:hypothetical protein
MKDYLIRIKKAELVDDKFGKHIKVTMIGLYDENGKWIKWTKINENILDVLLSNDINVSIK